MSRFTPLFVSERNAAVLLDMKPAEFRSLVKAGYLPGPRPIGKHQRWEVELLHRIANGELVESEGMEW